MNGESWDNGVKDVVGENVACRLVRTLARRVPRFELGASKGARSRDHRAWYFRIHSSQLLLVDKTNT